MSCNSVEARSPAPIPSRSTPVVSVRSTSLSSVEASDSRKSRSAQPRTTLCGHRAAAPLKIRIHVRWVLIKVLLWRYTAAPLKHRHVAHCEIALRKRGLLRTNQPAAPLKRSGFVRTSGRLFSCGTNHKPIEVSLRRHCACCKAGSHLRRRTAASLKGLSARPRRHSRRPHLRHEPQLR
jgi:hypothetical protein